MSSPSTRLVPDLSEECEFSGLAKYECSHCRGDLLGDEKSPTLAQPNYGLTGRPFPAQYSGVCAVDPDHRIRKGQDIQRIVRTDNPFMGVKGFACKLCILELPNA